MYIEPNTIIKLLSNCPLDTTYDHTIFFESVEDQITYFSSLAKYTLNHQTYQRVNKGTMRIQLKADDIYDCNYLMFQNTSFGNKWFYGFIKSVEYLNNITSEITFEIDVLQSWLFDYTLGQCFVEREHTITDLIGEHTVPENLETGPYISTSQTELLVEDLNLYMFATETLDLPYFEGPDVVGGFPVPCYWARFGTVSGFSVGEMKEIIDKFAEAGKSDAIIAIFTCPHNMVSTTSDLREQFLDGAGRNLPYTPKNNKLFTYPYCCLTINALGQAAELRYELFNESPRFLITGGFGPNMEVICLPLNYAGQTWNVEHMISIKGWPVCAWISDYFQNWVAQNKASVTLGTITSAVGGLLGTTGSLLTGSAVGATASLTGGLTSVLNQLNSIYQNSIIPDKMVGAANAPDIEAIGGYSGFRTNCKTIRPEYAKIIDDFFNVYGYKINSVKIPNINVRPHWTYTKTHGCVIHGSVPCDDMYKISQIFNNGITFWKNGNEIGDYSLDNSPN